ncbi:hypothetical protein SEA_BUTTON_12 [Gordonia phage Button]|nr:hypothetical protein SEA_BUTTON_12 [Gordonia phage Button]WKW84805.1 hypothetical protein SEA_JAMZY_14 [Gordonia phage Jamzy]
MGSVRLNRKGFRAIRSAPGMKAKNDELARKIADACNEHIDGDGYRTSSVEGADRPYGRHRATVITATAEAQADNAKNHTLLKEFYSVRD